MLTSKAKLLIALSPSIEEADKVISENYDFRSAAEKIAFLKGMFDVECISVRDAEGVSKEESDKMTYFAMLQAILNL